MNITDSPIEVKINGYDLKVSELKNSLIVHEIKTTKQRKYRPLIDFYYEFTNTKENDVNRMLRHYGRNNNNSDKLILESDNYINKLDINKNEIIEEYRKVRIKELQGMIEVMTNKKYK